MQVDVIEIGVTLFQLASYRVRHKQPGAEGKQSLVALGWIVFD